MRCELVILSEEIHISPNSVSPEIKFLHLNFACTTTKIIKTLMISYLKVESNG